MSGTDEDGVLGLDSRRSDAELITAVRSGEMAAYGELWSRHEGAARRFAASIARPGDVEELVSESFFRVLRAINGGGGPSAAFRAYLFQAMRNANVDAGRAYLNRVVLTDDDRVLDIDQAPSAAEVSAEDEERAAAVRAWASLPESSRTLLWHLIIEEETPAQIAPILGISANGVSSRAVRAKERLRQAFLRQQVSDAEDEACKQAREKFGAFLRGALPASGRQRLEDHLAVCARGCPEAMLEISDINRTLRGVIAPVVLGGSLLAAKYLGAPAAAAVASGTAGAAAAGGLRALLRPPVLVSGTVAAISGLGVAALILARGGTRPGADGVAPAPPASRSAGTAPPLASRTPTPPRPTTEPSTSASTSAVATPTPPAATTSVVPPPPLPVPTTSGVAVARPVTVTVRSSSGSGRLSLTATVPAGWRFSTASAAVGGRCQLSGSTASCEVPAPVPGAHRFEFIVLPPDGGSTDAHATMQVRYTDASGTTTQDVEI